MGERQFRETCNARSSSELIAAQLSKPDVSASAGGITIAIARPDTAKRAAATGKLVDVACDSQVEMAAQFSQASRARQVRLRMTSLIDSVE